MRPVNTSMMHSGPIKQACWTGPTFPNQTTNFVSSNCVVNCTTAATSLTTANGSGSGKAGCLFRLDEDEGEYNDLGGDTDQAARLNTMLDAIHAGRKDAYNPKRGKSDPKACEAAVNLFGGYWGPFIQ